MHSGIWCAPFALMLVLAGGCAPGPFEERAWPEPRPLGRGLETVRPSRDPGDVAGGRVFEQPTGLLSLRDALAAALVGSPDLSAAGYEVRVREAEALQAGRLSNPELGVEFENFGGRDELDGIDALETTLALSQIVELGGKRLNRQRVANDQARLAGWEYEIRRIDVLSKTAADFVHLLAAERRVQNADDTLQLVQRVFDVVGERVEAGKVSPVERFKAQVELAQAALAREQAQRARDSARSRLAANWGSTDPKFDSLAGDFDQTAPVPTLEGLLGRLDQNPDLARWTAVTALRQAEVELALSQRIPDFTVSGGVRHFNEIDEMALVAGFSMPLPIFSANQGGVRAARLAALQGGRLEDAARVRVHVAVVEAYQTLDAASLTVHAIRDQILPSAEFTFEAAEEAFRQGKIGALDLLDAERTLFDARGQLTDALATYHFAVIASERLIGAPLGDDDQSEGTDP